MITFSILSGLLNYTFMPINMMMFRNKWPLGSIKRGYHPSVPPAAGDRAAGAVHRDLLRDLSSATAHQLMAMMLFYILVSLWFVFFRYRYVRRGDQFTMPWPRPQGY